VAQDRIMEKVISEKLKQGMRRLVRGPEMPMVQGPDVMISQNVDIHLGRLIKGDAWHLIQEIVISRLGGLSMEHNMSSCET
jgi:hypothetical protein